MTPPTYNPTVDIAIIRSAIGNTMTTLSMKGMFYLLGRLDLPHYEEEGILFFLWDNRWYSSKFSNSINRITYLYDNGDKDKEVAIS